MTAPHAAVGVTQAVDFLNAGRVDLAERFVRQVLAADPENAEAHRVLGACLRSRDDLASALAEADESIRLTPDSAYCHLERGRTLHALGKLGPAEREIREALQIGPILSPMFVSLAAVLRDRGQLPGAEQAARSGLALNPENAACLASLALTLMLRHRFRDASEALRSALAGDPERAELHNSLGIELMHRGLLPEAEDEFHEALRLNPQLEVAKDNLQVAIDGHKQRLKTPYFLRLGFEWPHFRPRLRVSALLALLAMGLMWPIAWGVVIFPATHEIRHRVAVRWSPARKWQSGVAVYAGLIGLALLFSAARTGVLGQSITSDRSRDVVWQPPPTIDFLGLLASASPDSSGHIQIAIPLVSMPKTGPTPSHEPTPADREMSFAFLQGMTGMMLFLAIQPALLTAGRPKRVATALALAATVFAVAGVALSSSTNLLALGVAFVAVPVVAWLGPRVVFRMEKAEFR